MSREHFSDRIKRHEAPVDPNAWADMEALLDGKAAATPKKRSGRKFLGLLLLLIIFTGAGLYGIGAFQGSTEQKTQENTEALNGQQRPVADTLSSAKEGRATTQNEDGRGQTQVDAGESASNDLSFTRTAKGAVDGELKPDKEYSSSSAEVPVASINRNNTTISEGNNDAKELQPSGSLAQEEEVASSSPQEIASSKSMDGSAEEGALAVDQVQSSHSAYEVKDDTTADDQLHAGEALDVGSSEQIGPEPEGNEGQPGEETAAELEEDERVRERKDVQKIETLDQSGTGGDLPSGITSVGLILNEGRPKGPPILESTSTTNSISLDRVSFFIGYSQVSTDFFIDSDDKLSGNRWNLGITYLLDERLSVVSEYGIGRMSAFASVANGIRRESMNFGIQHINLRYLVKEGNISEVRLYGGLGYGRFDTETYIDPATSTTPNPGPIDLVRRASDIVTIDAGISGLCTLGNILIESRMGIMYSNRFADGGWLDNWGVNIYWRPRKKAVKQLN